MEPYYELRIRSGYRVEPDGTRTEVRPGIEQWRDDDLAWGYHGSGPLAAANALLFDAGRSGPDIDQHRLAMAFVSDVLAFAEINQPFVIAVREVRAWLDDRASEVLSERLPRPEDPIMTNEELADAAMKKLEGGPKSLWLDAYRTIHGQPDLPV